MKYFFATLTLIAILFLGNASLLHAQTSSCDVINSQDAYNNCCTGIAPEGDVNSCMNYAASQQVQQTNAQCSNITTQSQYDSCCPSGANNTSACAAYYASTNAVVPVAGTINSAPSTAPVNIASTNTALGGNPAISPTAADQQAVASCSNIQFKTLLDIAIWAKCMISVIVIPGIFTLAFVVFLWGVFKFIRSPDQKDKEESKQFIYMGLIGLFVMVSVWGIIKIFGTTLGIDSTVPTLQTDYLNVNKADTK